MARQALPQVTTPANQEFPSLSTGYTQQLDRLNDQRDAYGTPTGLAAFSQNHPILTGLAGALLLGPAGAVLPGAIAQKQAKRQATAENNYYDNIDKLSKSYTALDANNTGRALGMSAGKIANNMGYESPIPAGTSLSSQDLERVLGGIPQDQFIADSQRTGLQGLGQGFNAGTAAVGLGQQGQALPAVQPQSPEYTPETGFKAMSLQPAEAMMPPSGPLQEAGASTAAQLPLKPFRYIPAALQQAALTNTLDNTTDAFKTGTAIPKQNADILQSTESANNSNASAAETRAGLPYVASQAAATLGKTKADTFQSQQAGNFYGANTGSIIEQRKAAAASANAEADLKRIQSKQLMQNGGNKPLTPSEIAAGIKDVEKHGIDFGYLDKKGKQKALDPAIRNTPQYQEWFALQNELKSKRAKSVYGSVGNSANNASDAIAIADRSLNRAEQTEKAGGYKAPAVKTYGNLKLKFF